MMEQDKERMEAIVLKLEQFSLKAADESLSVEDRFIASWQHIQLMVDTFYRSKIPFMLPIISQLRQRGYDSKLRLGLSVISLCLSRSKEHGLRSDQPYALIRANEHGGLVFRYFSCCYPWGEDALIKEVITENIELTQDAESLLQYLCEHPID